MNHALADVDAIDPCPESSSGAMQRPVPQPTSSARIERGVVAIASRTLSRSECAGPIGSLKEVQKHVGLLGGGSRGGDRVVAV